MKGLDFTGRVVVITGAGGGLGREYALEIARRGGAVVVNDNGGDHRGDNPGPEMADSVTAEITSAGGKAIANYEDVGDRDGAFRIAEQAISEFGRIDALINNAGNLRNAWFEDFTPEDRDAVIRTHLFGSYNVTQAVWPHMKKAGYGRVVFASSGAGMFGNQMQSAYGAAKAGLTGLMNVLAQEGKPHGILCNALLPNAESRMGAEMDPAEMAPIAPYFPLFEGSVTPPFIMAMVVYMCSEACQTTHDLYSVMAGRIARGFIGVTEGWLGPRDVPPTVEQVAEHIGEIRDVSRGIHIPSGLMDEFRIVAEQIKASKD